MIEWFKTKSSKKVFPKEHSDHVVLLKSYNENGETLIVVYNGVVRYNSKVDQEIISILKNRTQQSPYEMSPFGINLDKTVSDKIYKILESNNIAYTIENYHY
jgi:hypothetical protein